MKRKLKLLAKVVLTAAALGFVLHKIDVERLKSSLQSAEPLWLLGAFLFFNLSKIASAHRLNLYFDAIGVRLTFGYNLILYYVGMFYNLFLPGGIGGDGYKIYLLNRRFGHGVKGLFQALLLDRVSGLAALLLFTALLFAASEYADPYPGIRAAALAGGLFVFPAIYFTTKRFFPPFLHVFGRTMRWGMAVQFLQLVSAWMILESLGIGEATLAYLALFLLSSVVAILPLTIGGMGVRELTFLYGMEWMGKEPSTGVTFSFLFFAVTVLSSLLGLFLLRRVEPEFLKKEVE
ncbi:lysylphosphatidylglycerol synthase transmembrane domain-containing protein [Hydrogenimonas sp.]